MPHHGHQQPDGQPDDWVSPLRTLVAELEAFARPQPSSVRHLLGIVTTGIRLATNQAQLSERITMGKYADKIHGLDQKLTTSYGETAAAKATATAAVADLSHYKDKADKYDEALAAGKITDDADEAAVVADDPTPPAETPVPTDSDTPPALNIPSGAAVTDPTTGEPVASLIPPTPAA